MFSSPSRGQVDRTPSKAPSPAGGVLCLGLSRSHYKDVSFDCVDAGRDGFSTYFPEDRAPRDKGIKEVVAHDH